jgi:hypothetical protein
MSTTHGMIQAKKASKKRQQQEKSKQWGIKIIETISAMKNHPSIQSGHKMSGALLKDIPYFHAKFKEGTQFPTIRLHFTQNTITVTAATLFNTVLTLQASIFEGFGDLANVFSEYRVIDGFVCYRPVLEYRGDSSAGFNAGYHGGAILDYTSVTALTSLQSILSSDTGRTFYWTMTPSQKYNYYTGVCSWKFDPERLPDQTWINTGTINTPFAYWKPYLPASAVSSTTGAVGYTDGWMDVQFRGLKD